jgi:hypothetical protein
MGTERQGYGFGYVVWVGNPAARSFAVINADDVRGDALAYAGRVHWDWGKPLHVEISYGGSQMAGGIIVDDNGTPGDPSDDFEVETEDYKVFDIGVASEILNDRLELKLEYISGEDIRGVKGYKQSTGVFTVGYLFADWGQIVAKTYQAEAELTEVLGLEKSKMGNTFLGLNFFFARLGSSHRDLQRNKIVVNYIFANGDGKDNFGSEDFANPPWYGIGGFADDTWGVQWQYKF